MRLMDRDRCGTAKSPGSGAGWGKRCRPGRVGPRGRKVSARPPQGFSCQGRHAGLRLCRRNGDGIGRSCGALRRAYPAGRNDEIRRHGRGRQGKIRRIAAQRQRYRRVLPADRRDLRDHCSGNRQSAARIRRIGRRKNNCERRRGQHRGIHRLRSQAETGGDCRHC